MYPTISKTLVFTLILLRGIGMNAQNEMNCRSHYGLSLGGIHFKLGQNGLALNNSYTYTLNNRISIYSELSLGFGKYTFEASGQDINYSEARVAEGKLGLVARPFPRVFNRLELGVAPAISYYSSVNSSGFKKSRVNQIQGSTYFIYTEGFLENILYTDLSTSLSLRIFDFSSISVGGYFEANWNYSPFGIDFFQGGIQCRIPLSGAMK
jgi:hypothetical protein